MAMIGTLGNNGSIMGKKKKNNKNVVPAPQKKKTSGEKNKGKISKAREAVREEIRSILSAAREKNLIEKTTSTVRKVRSFTTEDILNFISDVKVKTKNEVKKITPKHDNNPKKDIIIKKEHEYQPIKVKAPESIQEGKKSTSYYDRWYNLVVNKGQTTKK